MTKNVKILLIILVVLILAGIFVYYLNTKPTISPSGFQPTNTPLMPLPTPTPLPPATGNIDDAVNALLQAANDEQSTIGNGADDKTLIISDIQEISGFSQSANENEF